MSNSQSIAAKAYETFHSTCIPLGGRVTAACIAAGADLATLARSHGVQMRLFRRDEYHFSPVARQRMRAFVAGILADLAHLPASPAKLKAVGSLRKYSEVLSCY